MAGFWRTVLAARRFDPDVVLEMGEGDREAVLGWLSGARDRIGYLPGRPRAWRRLLMTRTVPWGGPHVIEANLDLVRACGIRPEGDRPVLAVQPETRRRMAERLASLGIASNRAVVVVHPVSRWLFKAWPEAGCAEVLRHLARREEITVVVTSGPDAKEVEAARRILARASAPVIDIVGGTTLQELAAVLERAALFIGVDSAPMHMAAALGVPVIALFGPSGEKDWGPWGDGHAVLTAPFLCRPCGKDGCLGSKQSDCLEAISAAEVIGAAERMLNGGPGSRRRG
jgi:heptosyltransferase-3